ncbi:hypothetical protein [Nevskia ramosa]|uniref:hypothetical protein n=1 Tax=Nevskia ramosa TaxID=64002 RepID=UPI00235512F0|nr:hypothetical protein [Nevskia ramosa]
MNQVIFCMHGSDVRGLRLVHRISRSLNEIAGSRRRKKNAVLEDGVSTTDAHQKHRIATAIESNAEILRSMP